MSVFLKPLTLERLADCADATVHHVGWSQHIASGLRLRQRLTDQRFEGFVVGDLAFDEKAVMSVRGVGIERNVADDAHLRHARLDGADRPADEIFRVERLARRVVPKVRLRIGEKRNGRHAKLRGLFSGVDRKIHREPLHARHGRNSAAAPFFRPRQKSARSGSRQTELFLRQERATRAPVLAASV